MEWFRRYYGIVSGGVVTATIVVVVVVDRGADHFSLQVPSQDIDLEGLIHHGHLLQTRGYLDPEMNGQLSKTLPSLVEHLHCKTGI
jgi:hypothetical protein